MNRQKILSSVLAIVLLGAGFYYYSVYFRDDSPVVDIFNPEAQTVVGEDILQLIPKLENLSIDASIFSNVLFTSLKDSSAPLFPEAKFRPNPFASVGNDSGR